VRRFRVVANKTESSQQGLDLYASLTTLTDRHLDVLLDYCGSIPLDVQLKHAVAQRRAVVEAFPRSSAALAFRKLATKVARWPQPQTPCGHIEFFVERLIEVANGTR
jgi:flagellar biosynthesis protein FlhG